MQGPEQLPDEGQTIITQVGTGLQKATKVKAKVHGVSDEQIAYEVLEVVGDGDADPEVGQRFGADPDGFYWEVV